MPWRYGCGHSGFEGQRIGFGGREARTLIRDWAHTALTGRYEPANSTIDFESCLKRMKTPVLAVTLENDRFAPRRSAANLCFKMDRVSVRTVHLTRRDMTSRGLHHFRWVQHSETIVEIIRRWVKTVERPTSGLHS